MTSRRSSRTVRTERASRSSSRTRSESKELTRKALLRAGLKLLSRHSFDAISLREITRTAGITPTAFYRHFDDMEDLGLALVDESFGSLRQMLRDARSNPRLTDDAIRGSIQVVLDHVRDHEAHMRFIARERNGGVSRLRRAITRELQLFTDELALDLASFPVVSAWPAEDRGMLADLIVETMVSLIAEILDARPEQFEELAARTEQQLRLITLGVPHWRP